jgi:hypothetical protein
LLGRKEKGKEAAGRGVDCDGTPVWNRGREGARGRRRGGLTSGTGVSATQRKKKKKEERRAAAGKGGVGRWAAGLKGKVRFLFFF